MATIQICPDTFLLVRGLRVEQHEGNIDAGDGAEVDVELEDPETATVLYEGESTEVCLAWAEGRNSITGQPILTV